MEHVIYSNLIAHWNVERFFIHDQHGFRTEASCSTVLVYVFHFLTRAIDARDEVEFSFLDSRKAFDFARRMNSRGVWTMRKTFSQGENEHRWSASSPHCPSQGIWQSVRRRALSLLCVDCLWLMWTFMKAYRRVHDVLYPHLSFLWFLYSLKAFAT